MRGFFRLTLCALVVILGVAGAIGPVGATELGGNYNQYICDMYNGLVSKSGVSWVRAFVNVPRNFLAYDDPSDPNRVTGVERLNLSQPSDAVSGASEQLGIQTATKLRQLKHTGAPGPAPRFILNLKLDMKYLPETSGPIPLGPIPAPGSAAYGYWLDAIRQLLTRTGQQGLDVGPAVDVLVLGNEPMFEVPDDPNSAAEYKAFLHALIDDVVSIRDAAGQDYQIFVGALDKPSQAPTSPILNAVIDEANTNDNVEGLDLHLHEDSLQDAKTDLDFIRSTKHVSKPLTVTEFSLVGLWNANANQALGEWGPEHGYPEDMTMAAWLNALMSRASAGDAVSSAAFASFFEEQPWYPEHWFDEFMEEFEDHDVMAATYGLSAPPNVEDLPFACAPSALIPLTPDGQPQPSAFLWVLDFVYNGALLGMAPDGFYNLNPLVADDFAHWIGNDRAPAAAPAALFVEPTFTG